MNVNQIRCNKCERRRGETFKVLKSVLETSYFECVFNLSPFSKLCAKVTVVRAHARAFARSP